MTGQSQDRLPGVLFDAAGTLFSLSPPLHELVAALIVEHGGNCSADQLLRGIQHVDRTVGWPDDQHTSSARVQAWSAFIEQAIAWSQVDGISKARRGIAQAAAAVVNDPDRYRLFPDVGACLSWVAGTGMPTGIISNFDDLLFDILDATGLRGEFPVVVTSYRIGVYKPDPLIFQAAILRCAVDPARTFYVGDSIYSDMGGACTVGMKGVLIDRAGNYPNYNGLRISSLVELAELADL